MLDKEDYVHAEESGANLVFERLKIIPDYHKVLLDDEEVILSNQQYQLLLYLARKPGRVYTYEQIYESIWEKEYAYDKGNVMAWGFCGLYLLIKQRKLISSGLQTLIKNLESNTVGIKKYRCNSLPDKIRMLSRHVPGKLWSSNRSVPGDTQRFLHRCGSARKW